MKSWVVGDLGEMQEKNLQERRNYTTCEERCEGSRVRQTTRQYRRKEKKTIGRKEQKNKLYKVSWVETRLASVACKERQSQQRRPPHPYKSSCIDLHPFPTTTRRFIMITETQRPNPAPPPRILALPSPLLRTHHQPSRPRTWTATRSADPTTTTIARS